MAYDACAFSLNRSDLCPAMATAACCPGNPDALGTARTIEVDAKSTPRVGRKQFPSTLPLRAKELVLTFDDGPWPGTTPKVLDALEKNGGATFFLLGRNVAARPQIARRTLAEGHSIGHHSYSHPLLDHMSATVPKQAPSNSRDRRRRVRPLRRAADDADNAIFPFSGLRHRTGRSSTA